MLLCRSAGNGKNSNNIFPPENSQNRILLIPQLLSAADEFISTDWSSEKMFTNSHLKLLSAASSAQFWTRCYRSGLNKVSIASAHPIPIFLANANRSIQEFDIRLLDFVSDGFSFLERNQHKEWLKFVNRPKAIAEEMDAEATTPRHKFTVLIDRLDDSWNGSDKAVVLVMALMHACMEINATIGCVRTLVFIRENVFERVRSIDKESSRLETAVVSLEWTRELLREFIERRLNRKLRQREHLAAQLGMPSLESAWQVERR